MKKTETELLQTGWKKKSLGQFRSSGQIKELQGFDLYIRETPFDDFIKKSSSRVPANPHKHCISSTGPSSTMGEAIVFIGPDKKNTSEKIPNLTKFNENMSKDLPEVSDFGKYPSLLKLRRGEFSLLIGFDSEWDNETFDRKMISWQYATIYNETLYEFLFFRTGDENLSQYMGIVVILDYLDVPSVDVRSIKRYKVCTGFDSSGKPIVKDFNSSKDALNEAVYVYRGDRFTKEKICDMIEKPGKNTWSQYYSYLDYSLVNSINVTLVCHAGKVDLSSLSYSDKEHWIMRYLTEVQGGLITLKSEYITQRSLKDVNNQRVYPISLSVADTMCHAPAGMKKLQDLGRVVGVNKLELPDGTKNHMLTLLREDPARFAEYASTDSVVALIYASSLYGYNRAIPATVTSASSHVMKDLMMGYLGCDTTESFNRKYRGLQTIGHGLIERDDKPGFLENTSLEPISDKANTIQYYASHAYHGGYNSCSEVGYFPFETSDFDLKNAYSTAMCLVPDINWENPVRSEIINRNLMLSDWVGIGGLNPVTPFVGYVKFSFPETVKYPCIPINVDGVPIYPRTSDGLDGVYVAGPFLYLALKLGATVFCERGYFLNTLYTDETYTTESRSIGMATKQMVHDRDLALENDGKGSLEELILKTMVNAGYGKNAQNVIQKSTWSAYRDVMESLGCSAITNPVSAMMTTSIVQCVLLAAQNQCFEQGYMSCSVTTDGFITNCPEKELAEMDLYGFRLFMEQSRLFLTDGQDASLWVKKHHQDDLVNFTTRGNVSLSPNGVCAHNSTKSGYEPDSYEDRHWLMTQVLNRTGPVEYSVVEWTSFKDLIQGKPFLTEPKTRHVRMDFDMKRKPQKESFVTDYPVIEGVTYEIAHFDTVPFEDVREFKLYRQKKELVKVLRTEADWSLFWVKLSLKDTGAKVRDLNWSILNSCVMGHRSGAWNIPMLNVGSVEDKCEWLNKHNTSSKKFKEGDWKHCRDPKRQVNMLPKELLADKLAELMADTPA